MADLLAIVVFAIVVPAGLGLVLLALRKTCAAPIRIAGISCAIGMAIASVLHDGPPYVTSIVLVITALISARRGLRQASRRG